MRKTGLLMTAFLLLTVSTVFAADSVETITTAGSRTIRPITALAAQAFKKTHPDVSIVIGGGGNSAGVEAAGKGEVDIGHCARSLTDREMKVYPDLVAHKIGIDALVLIVNTNNPVTTISKEQVRDIYTGRIRNWKEIGGHDEPITLYSKGIGHGILDLFLEHFDLEAQTASPGRFNEVVYKKKADETFAAKSTTVITSNKKAVAAVSTKMNAIAYVSIGAALDTAGKGARIALLELDGAKPTIENVLTAAYPFQQPLYVLTKGEPQGLVQKFIDLLQGEVGKRIIASREFIPIL